MDELEAVSYLDDLEVGGIVEFFKKEYGEKFTEGLEDFCREILVVHVFAAEKSTIPKGEEQWATLRDRFGKRHRCESCEFCYCAEVATEKRRTAEETAEREQKQQGRGRGRGRGGFADARC